MTSRSGEKNKRTKREKVNHSASLTKMFVKKDEAKQKNRL